MRGRDKVTEVMVRVVFLEAMCRTFFFLSLFWGDVRNMNQ